MKKIFTYITLVFGFCALAQNGNVGIGTNNPDVSAALEMASTTQGLLISRVALNDVTDAVSPINAPATGLLVYNNNAAIAGGDGEGFYYFDSTVWVKIGTAAGWDLLGNAGTTAGANYIGTSNGQDFIIKTNAIEAMRVEAGGDIGIGTTNPTTMLHVEGTGIPATVYSMDFEGSLATVSQSNTSGAAVWTITTGLPINCNTVCTTTAAYINGGGSENDTLFLGTFTPLQNSIDISFGYGMDEETGGGGKAGDNLHVALFQAGLQVGVDLLNITDVNANDLSVVNATRAVTAGLPYEIRATFLGGNYAAIDNITVTQAASSVMRIQDGSEQAGHVLTSDANGYASWRDPKIALAEEDWSFFSGNTINDPMYHQGLVRGGSTAVATRTLDLDYAGSSAINPGATSFGLGSVELFADVAGLNLIIAVSNSIAPQVDNTITLGRLTQAWREVFATGAVITTSDERLKENMMPLQYGIGDVMKLKPSEYYWTDEQYVKRGVPLTDKRKKLGLIAQDLLEVIPEVVSTHEWMKKSEKESDTFVLKKSDRLGVNYSELIPVLVKATQDQQKLIEKLKTENDRLEKLLAN